THMEIAFAFPAWSWLLFAGSLIVTVSQFLIDRGSTARWLRIATWVGIAIAVVTAIGATVQGVRVGHAGSVAVWGGWAGRSGAPGSSQRGPHGGDRAPGAQ